MYRAIQIVETSFKKEDVMLLKAFKEWKRLEFQIVLEGLRKYSETLEKNSARAFPVKRGFFN